MALDEKGHSVELRLVMLTHFETALTSLTTNVKRSTTRLSSHIDGIPIEIVEEGLMLVESYRRILVNTPESIHNKVSGRSMSTDTIENLFSSFLRALRGQTLSAGSALKIQGWLKNEMKEKLDPNRKYFMGNAKNQPSMGNKLSQGEDFSNPKKRPRENATEDEVEAMVTAAALSRPKTRKTTAYATAGNAANQSKGVDHKKSRVRDLGRYKTNKRKRKHN